MKTLYDSSVVSVPARCSPVGPAQAAASTYVTGLTTQQTLLLFAETLRLVLVVFATVQVHKPLKEELLLTPLLSLCGSRVWHRHLEDG